MIVITAPTSTIGTRLVAELLGAGQSVRLVVRDPSKLAPDLRERAEVVQGSHGNPAVVDRAFQGADAVFWLAPDDPTASRNGP